MNIKGMNKAEVLAALYNASKQQGMGFLHTRGARGMTVEEAQAEIDDLPNQGWGHGQMEWDYLHGRVMKVDITGDELDTWGFDRDNGQGAAERALQHLKGETA